MSTDLRPSTNAQRDTVALALDNHVTSPGADATLVMLDASLFAGPRAAYVEARERYERCFASARRTSSTADDASAAFDRDLRQFAASVRDEAGRATPRVVSALLGGVLPSTLLQKTDREKVTRTRRLLLHLPLRTELTYDADHAEALRASTDALEVATGADEEAERATLAAGAALRAAKNTFDDSYGRLLRAARAMLDQSTFLAVFPRFVGSDAGTAEVGTGAEGAGVVAT